MSAFTEFITTNKGYIELAAAAAAVFGAVFATWKYLRGKTRRQLISEVGTSFQTIVKNLVNGEEQEQLVAAILIRRFFRNQSEYRIGKDLPYSDESVEVISALLKRPDSTDANGEPGISDIVRKTLADGLREAPRLVGADFQNANLGDVFLGIKDSDGIVVDLSAADFYGASLQGSFRGIVGEKPIFMAADANNVVLKESKLKKADFRWARLNNCKFGEANLEGCVFGETSIRNCEFDSATVQNCEFDSATLIDCSFRSTKFVGQSSFAGTEISDCEFVGCDNSGKDKQRILIGSILHFEKTKVKKHHLPQLQLFFRQAGSVHPHWMHL